MNQNAFVDAKEFKNLSFESLEEAKLKPARKANVCVKKLGVRISVRHNRLITRSHGKC